jgi:hypothetical protein
VRWWPLFSFLVLFPRLRRSPLTTNCIAPALFAYGLWGGGPCFLFLVLFPRLCPQSINCIAPAFGFIRLWHPRMHLFLSVFYYLISTHPPRWWWRLAVRPFVGFPYGHRWSFLYDILYELHRLVLV